MSADYDAYGIPMRPVGERMDDLIDAIELMRGLWSNEKFTFEGKNVRVTDAVCDPKPIRGTIPIWTGAGKPRGLRIVGRLADGWIKNRGWASLEEISGMIAIAQKSAVRVGRDPDSIRCVLGGTGFVASNPAEAADFQAQNPSAAGLVGTTAEILTKIASYHKAGVDTFLVRPEGTDAAEQIAQFGKEIIPEVKRMAATARG